IAEHFMIPYNTKLWTVPPSEMAHAWCGRFVPLPTPEEVVWGALTPAGAGRALGYNATFLYPRQGGIGRLSEALAMAVPHPVRLGTPAMAIDWRARRVYLPDGAALAYDVLVSTAAVTELLPLMADVPQAVQDAARKLRATSVTYWDLGVARPNTPDDYHWIYYPEPDVPFYRAGSASAAVPSMAPPGRASFYVETAHAMGTPPPVSDEALLQGLRRVGLLGAREEPVLCERFTLGCAYTIMDHAYGPARQTVLEWLASQRILSVGRYGAWMYDSMEGAMLQGRSAAERVEALLA
ncbi:MAG TPA: FAD-dependent oxidoreductase, partial [Myxococcota bacterium]|nr:FAD-dependent oxidoreductase [Myxococcota bacterium]